MGKKSPELVRRKPRADAQRNRERILEAAKEAFTRSGAAASLDDIARQAGVGAGTLYRHFPTRDALLEAVYEAAVEKLAAAAAEFSEKLPPLEALRHFMLLFVDYVETKRIIAPALREVAGGMERLYFGSRGKIHAAFELLWDRAMRSGELRKDVEADDLVQAMIGVASIPSSPGWRKSARRLVEILIAGSRA